MKAIKRAVAVTGSYTDRQGNEKKRYTNIGTLFQYDDGNLTLKLDSVPVGDGWSGFVQFYEIEAKEQPKRGGGGGQADFNPVDGDEIPFATPYSIW